MVKPTLFLIAVLGLTSAWADYSGDYRVTTTGGRRGSHTLTGRMTSKPTAKKTRMDVTMPDGMGEVSNIVDGTARKVYAVMHSRRTIMEMDMSRWERENNGECMTVANAQECLLRLGFRKTGTETANGYSCDVYTKTETRNGVATTSKFYHPRDRADAPLTRMVMSSPNSNMQMDITNINYANVADSVFALPSGYTRQDASAMMGVLSEGKSRSGGKAPSGPEMERMQKMIQEQMRKHGH